MKQREQAINNYIEAYNDFNIERMVADFDDAIHFDNISNGKLTMSLDGMDAFLRQARHAGNLFSHRKQTVLSFDHREHETEVLIDYRAVLALDLPNGMKKGTELHLPCRSVFGFQNGKIVALTDIS